MYNSSLFLKKKTHVIRVKWKNGKTDMLSPNLKTLLGLTYTKVGTILQELRKKIIEWMPTTVI